MCWPLQILHSVVTEYNDTRPNGLVTLLITNRLDTTARLVSNNLLYNWSQRCEVTLALFPLWLKSNICQKRKQWEEEDVEVSAMSGAVTAVVLAVVPALHHGPPVRDDVLTAPAVCRLLIIHPYIIAYSCVYGVYIHVMYLRCFIMMSLCNLDDDGI